VLLRLEGIATIAKVYLNGELVLESDSMFASHALDVSGRLRRHNELVIHCLALGPLLRERRRPRARWRTRLVSEGNLRFFRTMLLGRTPGFAPGPAAVGPWRGVHLERRRRIAVE
jgi:beta-mannosidase